MSNKINSNDKSQFTDEEMWILRVAIEALWDEQRKKYSNNDTVEATRKLMMKIWNIIDGQDKQ